MSQPNISAEIEESRAQYEKERAEQIKRYPDEEVLNFIEWLEEKSWN